MTVCSLEVGIQEEIFNNTLNIHGPFFPCSYLFFYIFNFQSFDIPNNLSV